MLKRGWVVGAAVCMALAVGGCKEQPEPPGSGGPSPVVIAPTEGNLRPAAPKRAKRHEKRVALQPTDAPKEREKIASAQATEATPQATVPDPDGNSPSSTENQASTSGDNTLDNPALNAAQAPETSSEGTAPKLEAPTPPRQSIDVPIPTPSPHKTTVTPSLPAPPKTPKDTGVTVTIPPDTERPKPRRKPRHTQPASRGGRLALIIDDIGMSTGQVKPFLDLPADLTFSIIPETSQARRCLSLVKSRGKVSLLHLPMESFHRTELLPSDAIMVNLSSDEIERRVGKMLTELSGVEGVNNHMGSKATQDERVMESVLSVVKQRGLFFVDSKTVGETVVGHVADQLGVPHAARSGEFLDDGGNTSRTYQIVMDLAREAQRNGSAIGIGHPHPGTLKALARALPEVEAMGVQIVPVSELTH